ncbi:unnamed protein product [Soboliphyme baturini]|uniref:FERM_C domain-containing protein n=1 Tax=Soboliphyme baturini TaxID=241478 RepID=A0A183IM99_9BILA|nr:unnamed protein product [Soboliphyme baturini]
MKLIPFSSVPLVAVCVYEMQCIVLCKNLWSMAVAQHHFYLDYRSKKVIFSLSF